MKGITQHTGLVLPLDIANIDTDAIIPKQFLQKVTRTGFGQHLFHDWRFLDDAGTQENPDFILNLPRFQGASILLTRENFGCGSSREHAPWALADYGFQVIIAPSFADIFYANAINNQIVPVILAPHEIDTLFTYVNNTPNAKIRLDLSQKTITAEQDCYAFALDPFQHQCLLKGFDHIDLTLQHQTSIDAFETQIPSFLS